MTIYIRNVEEASDTKDKNDASIQSLHYRQQTREKEGVVEDANLSPATNDDNDDDNDPIDIPGLKNIWDSKYTLLGKLVWLIILITCTTLMLIHVINSVRYYLSKPVAVGIYIENNATMLYPDITLCNTEFWRKDLYNEVVEEIANINQKNASIISIEDILKHMTIMDLWNRVAFRIDDLVQAVSCLANLHRVSTVSQ